MNLLPVFGFFMSEHPASIFFKKNGFFIQENVFTQAMLTKANCAVADVMNGIYQTGTAPLYSVDVNSPRAINRIGQIHYADSRIHALLCNPAIGNMVARLSGASRVRLWGSQLYYKPPHQSKEHQIGYHRDTQHMPGILGGGLTLWIPLSDTTPDSGTLRYLIGSHRAREYLTLAGAHDPDVASQLNYLKSQLGEQRCQEFPVYLRAGGIAIHDQDTLHASLCNLSDHPRIAIAASIVTDKTRYHVAADTFGICDMINDPTRSYEYALDERLLCDRFNGDDNEYKKI